MDPELVFSIVNALPMPIWLTWMFAPRSKLARYFADALWPWLILAACYLALLGYALSLPGNGGNFSSLAGVMQGFTNEWAALAGWTHYLCFDLFVARWMIRDAPEAGYKLSPILVLTLMFGPVGLLVYAALRGWLTKGAEPEPEPEPS
ncbi:hypothetical protein PPSIR1_06276 [Plesiocystis pacifica SIR-1]|uniref:DUF4281 domain-containing protein n=1 Tax=Plesiocystis pacifica SIR-1 TaxID=391625 RepID=A6G6Y0_9BACT|nr:ABA4-like family protein [Plesiocystis pacifica]EDM78433.1 hypothetical protein PPSIR1_06276 [Plesiocystis pacifica SIR-1]